MQNKKKRSRNRERGGLQNNTGLTHIKIEKEEGLR